MKKGAQIRSVGSILGGKSTEARCGTLRNLWLTCFMRRFTLAMRSCKSSMYLKAQHIVSKGSAAETTGRVIHAFVPHFCGRESVTNPVRIVRTTRKTHHSICRSTVMARLSISLAIATDAACILVAITCAWTVCR